MDYCECSTKTKYKEYFSARRHTVYYTYCGRSITRINEAAVLFSDELQSIPVNCVACILCKFQEEAENV